MPKQFTYSAKERLKSRKLIEQLFANGKKLNAGPYRVHYVMGANVFSTDNPATQMQCGVGTVTRNFKKAVDRNRIKRLTREAWRLQKLPLSEKLKENKQQLALFIIYSGKEMPDFMLVTEKMKIILQKLNTIADETNIAHT